ncbi:MAG TPA: pyridoxal-dependent decarboxylase, partial [Chthoniobacterales bacterium]|nr:pyridoxal-dependent decarboxylase [Chthoniobacterales bacterium]
MKDREEHSRGEIGDLGDVSPEIFRKELHRLADWIADYQENLETLRVAPNAKPGAIQAALPAEPPEQAEPLERIFADIDRVIVPGMVNWGHPMFLGYFGWTTTAPGILGEIITAPLNVNAMTWRTCPAATELETVVVNWLRQWMLLPNEFGGVVYDTASVGIMHALAAAREEAAPATRKLGLSGRPDVPRFRVYASDQAHSSAEKAAIALGLGEENVQRVPSDRDFRMNVAELRE